MKQCPSCRTTYTDDTLSFCLADGTPLPEAAEEVTFVRSGRSDPMRFDIPQAAAPTAFIPAQAVQQPVPPALPEKGSNTMKILLVVGLLGGMIGLAVGGAAALIYFNKDARVAEPVGNIANIKGVATPPPIVPNNSTTQKAATVNSPGDGFLALRSLPNGETGIRIAKIPHGTTVTVGVCGPVVKPGNRTGHWCQTSYNGYSGWVFDAYLNY